MDILIKKGLEAVKEMADLLLTEIEESESTTKKKMLLNPYDNQQLYSAQSCLATLHHNIQYYLLENEAFEKERHRFIKLQREAESQKTEDVSVR